MASVRQGSSMSFFWPVLAGIGAGAVTMLFPPAFWLSGLGLILFNVVLTLRSIRTGNWSTLPWRPKDNGNFTRFEATALVSASVITAIPLVVIFLLSLAH
jgi:hypothetical protein